VSHAEHVDLSTTAVTAGRPARTPDAPLNTPIVPASSFIAGGDLAYAREGNPTGMAFEQALGALEGGIAVAFASGMAAANAVFDTLKHGARVLATRPAYAGVAGRLRELHDAGRIELSFLDAEDGDALVTAAADVDMVWLESPTNPMLVVPPVEQMIAAARKCGATVVFDNTFATPLLQRPLDFGADIVMHSATKALSGHSDLLMGALVVRSDEHAEQFRSRRVLLGAAPSAFDSYLALRGLRTLALRVERAQDTARLLAERLAAHPAISRVRYPGFGTMMAVEIAGTPAETDAVCSATHIWVHATSLGGVESLLERRRSWAMEDALVPETLIRLSVGIEHPEDLWSDLSQALSQVRT
jgi:cystathionine gamma-synthase